MVRINGGQLPPHAPKSLPAGVPAMDGWADRRIVLPNYAWVLDTAGRVIHLYRKHEIRAATRQHGRSTEVKSAVSAGSAESDM